MILNVSKCVNITDFYRSIIRVLTCLYFLQGVPLESVNDILDLGVIRSFHRFFTVRTDAVYNKCVRVSYVS